MRDDGPFAHFMERAVEMAHELDEGGGMKLECANCGAVWPGDLKKQWGRTAETSGYGPTMVCTALVRPDATSDAEEVCGGMLGAIPDDAADAARLITLREIAPN